MSTKQYKVRPYNIEDSLKITEFYTMFECFRPCGYVFSGESHKFWECVYVVRGNVCISTNERIYDMKTGDIAFHKPHELHKYHVIDDEGVNLFIFSFSLTGNLSVFFENKVFSLNEKQKSIMSSLLDFIHEKEASFSGKLPDSVFDCIMTLAIMNTSDTHMLFLTHHVHMLFLSICDSYNIASEADDKSAKIFKTAVSFMKENISLPLTVNEIAKKSCVSITGLKNIFLEYVGCSIHKYFLKLKINHAINLLSNGISVTEVAESLGFSSQAYFSTTFKRETGFSPTELKRTLI